MTTCPYTSQLDAYHDGEPDGPSARTLESHLVACSACQNRLEELEEISRLFGAASSDRLTARELEDVAEYAESMAGRPPIPLFGGLLAAAASIAIVCGAWLWQMPASRPGSTGMIARDSAAWELVAVHGFRYEAAVDSPGAAVADAQLAEWMLDGLTRTEVVHEN